jgi:enediyne biosynthesis protein E4
MTVERVGDIVADGDPGEDCWWGDYDNDGYPDLYRFRLLPGNPYSFKTLVYHNEGTGRFARVEVGSLTAGGGGSGGWADYDNDGWLDVLGGPLSGPLALHRNLGGTTFTNVAVEAGLDQRIRASSAGAWGDFDNDGDLDFLLWSFAGEKNLLYRNNGDGTFSSVEAGSPLNPLPAQRWVGPAWVDYDGDGFLDLFYGIGNGSPAPNALYRNNLSNLGNRNHWLKIGLRGTVSNRSGIGAKLRLTALIGGKPVTQLREIGPGISARSGQNGLVAHFGLGDAANVTLLRVEWPSGAITESTDLAVDQVHSVVEPMAIIPARSVVSLGDDVTLTCRGTGAIQWYFNGEAIAGATNRVLELSAITAEDAGRYTVVLSTATATHVFASSVRVDTQFTQITDGAVVEDPGNSYVPVWGDYDADGYVDLFVANGGNEGPTLQFIYRNLGDGTFSRMTAAEVGELANDKVQTAQGGWADIDNDGDLDLFIGSAQENSACRLYLNQGNGQFAAIMEDVGLNQPLWPWGSVWADYDNDGWVDLYLGSGWVSAQLTDCLMRNQGDGTFRACSGIPFRLMNVNFGSWGDADNDGDLDLFVGNFGSVNNAFYRNNGDGTFIDDTAAGLCPGAGGAVAPIWGDYDNDGDLDLFLTRNGGPCYYYKNQGDGTFLAISSEPALQTMGLCAAAGDYDNDGDLDLFVTRGQGSGACSLLLRNDGTGHFESTLHGSFPKAPGHFTGCSWVDYDNNGTLDLFVTTVNNEVNSLYRNNGNGNHWLIVRLKGTTSNAAAIGAKVRVSSFQSERIHRQLRQISGGSVDDLRAHFGMGSATQVRQLQIEWPSGTVQVFRNVDVDQILTVVEPRRPVLIATRSTGASVALALTGDAGAVYQLQASSNLMDWAVVGTVTNELGQCSWTDPEAGPVSAKFYRAIRTGP